MSLYTTILSLFKYNLDTDGKNTYNIQLALNDNWDKIDAFAKSILANVETVKGTITTKFNELNTAKTNLNLDNIKPTSTILKKIANSISPVYEQRFSINSGWVSSSPCLIHIMGQSDRTTTVNINGADFQISYDTGDGQSAGSAQFLIGSGTTVTFSACRQAVAIPLKFVY